MAISITDELLTLMSYRKDRITRMQTVLAVDDVLSNLLAIQSILEKGYAVSLAPSADEALKILRRACIDVAVLDIAMPGMSGLELFAEMQKAPILQTIPAVFVTAGRDSDTVKKAMRMGAAGYIVKPYDGKLLMQTVYRVLKAAKVDQGAAYLIKKMREISAACEAKDGTASQKFLEIPPDLFNSAFTFRLNRLSTYLSNRDFDNAARAANDVVESLRTGSADSL